MFFHFVTTPHYIQFPGACLLSFTWILMMRHISSLMIWFSILSLLSLLVLAVTYCVLRLQALYQENQEGSDKSLLEVTFFVLVGLKFQA